MQLCNVDDDGTINAYLGDTDFTRDGSNGQVMVKIPRFYYRHSYQNDGENEEHQFWIADGPAEGFSLHPCFLRDGEEKDYVLVGAYKAGKTKAEDEVTDLLTSVSAALPAVQKTRAQFRVAAQERGPGWNIVDALSRNAIALLYLVEYADTDCQAALGKGIVGLRWSVTDTVTVATNMQNTITVSAAKKDYFYEGEVVDVGTQRGNRLVCSNRNIIDKEVVGENLILTVDGDSFSTEVGNVLYHVGQKTGGCDSLGGASGMAEGTNGRVSVAYRGLEDLWGNVWEFVDGMNIKNADREPYIADSNFADDRFSAEYKPTGITLPETGGFNRDFAYSPTTPWLLVPDEVGENDGASYIPDNFRQNWYGNTGDKVAIIGGNWMEGLSAGLFNWILYTFPDHEYLHCGARLMYIP